MSFFFVYFKYLFIASYFYLFKKFFTFLNRSFLDEKMSGHVLCYVVNAIQVIVVNPFYLYIFFIKMLPSFKFWLYAYVKRILKKRNTFLSNR